MKKLMTKQPQFIITHEEQARIDEGNRRTENQIKLKQADEARLNHILDKALPKPRTTSARRKRAETILLSYGHLAERFFWGDVTIDQIKQGQRLESGDGFTADEVVLFLASCSLQFFTAPEERIPFIKAAELISITINAQKSGRSGAKKARRDKETGQFEQPRKTPTGQFEKKKKTYGSRIKLVWSSAEMNYPPRRRFKQSAGWFQGLNSNPLVLIKSVTAIRWALLLWK